MPQSPEDLLQHRVVPLLYGFAISQIFATGVRLGIPQALGDSSRTVAELAEATGTDRDALRRLLRSLTGIGVLEQPSEDRFALSDFGAALRPEAATPLHSLAALYTDQTWWRAWGRLEESVRTGKSAFAAEFGKGLFDVLAEQPEFAERFNAGMTAVSQPQIPWVVDGYDFSGFGHVVDVGGGDGSLLAAILAATPGLRGTLFDTEKMIEPAARVLGAAGVADRADAVAGDFFVSVPAGADAYLMKHILHDWNDEECVQILRSCRTAIGDTPGAKVLVPAMIIPAWDDAQDDLGKVVTAWMDMEMLVMTTGRERTVAEHAELFQRSGLRLGEVVPLEPAMNWYLVEGLPV